MRISKFAEKYCCDPGLLDEVLEKYPYFRLDGYSIRDSDEEALIEAYYGYKDELREQRKERIILRQYDVPMSTTSGIAGYEVLEHKGLVFGEVVIKAGFFKTLYAGVENIISQLEWGEQEMDGSSRLLNDARQYAIRKMKEQAVEQGGNAIVGIDCESSHGGDLMHITMYGTAVKVRKIEE